MKAPVGLLTKKNLEEQIDSKYNSNKEVDIDIESVYLDQSTFSPRAANNKEITSAQAIV